MDKIDNVTRYKLDKIGQKYKSLTFSPVCKSSHAMDHCKIMAQLYYKKA